MTNHQSPHICNFANLGYFGQLHQLVLYVQLGYTMYVAILVLLVSFSCPVSLLGYNVTCFIVAFIVLMVRLHNKCGYNSVNGEFYVSIDVTQCMWL